MPVTAKQIRDMVPGMASWPGGGPPGAQCRDCSWFPLDKYMTGKSQRCGKYTRLTNGKNGPKIAPTNRACRYFDPGKGL